METSLTDLNDLNGLSELNLHWAAQRLQRPRRYVSDLSDFSAASAKLRRGVGEFITPSTRLPQFRWFCKGFNNELTMSSQ